MVTVEPRYNEPLYNKGLGVLNDFLFPVIVEYMKKNLDVTKPLPVPWPFVILRWTTGGLSFNQSEWHA